MTDLREGLFQYPFRELYRHIKDFEDYKVNPSGLRSKHSPAYNEKCDAHIGFLLTYLSAQSTINFHAHQEDWGRPSPVTSFEGLGFLLEPGTDVYVRERKDVNAYVLEEVQGGIEYTDEGYRISPYIAFVWKLVFDGKRIMRGLMKFEIPIFDGKRKITDLEVFPTGFLDNSDGGSTKQRLVARGKRYFSFCESPAFLEYTGSGLKPGWQNVS